MGDAVTEKAIRDNIHAILTGFGWQLHSLSVNPALDTVNYCHVEYEAWIPEETFNQRPSRPEAQVAVWVLGNRQTPDLAFDMQVDAKEKIKTSINVAALNVGALAASKLITAVQHLGADMDYDQKPLARIRYRLQIRYRET